MTKDEALDKALEALEWEEAQTAYPTRMLTNTIAAIKQARSAPVQEPVCKECNGSGEIETGIGMMTCTDCPPAAQRPDVDAMIALVRADEREACAKVCEELHWTWHMGDNSGPKECAAAIRARGNT